MTQEELDAIPYLRLETAADEDITAPTILVVEVSALMHQYIQEYSVFSF